MATKRKVRRFDVGGMPQYDDAEGVDAAVAANTDTGEWARGENYGDGTTGDERVAMARAPRREATQEDIDSLVAAPRFEPEAETKKTFKQAFAAARGAGDKTFEWNGKKYTTEMASGASKPTTKTSSSDETARLAKRYPAYKAPVADETARLAKRYPSPVRTTARADAGDSQQSRILRDVTPGRINPKTLLPYKKGGAVSASSRADGIAKRGKTRGTMR